jgi:hypothetical protein
MKSPFRSTRMRVALVAGVVVLAGTGLAVGSRADAGTPAPSPALPYATGTRPSTATSTTSTPATTVVPTTTISTAPVAADPTLFVQNVNAFYGRYTKLEARAGTRELIKKYVALPYGSTLNGPSVDYDQVLCAQNTPERFAVGAPVVKENGVTVTISTYWSDGPYTFDVTGDAASGLITNLACPGR